MFPFTPNLAWHFAVLRWGKTLYFPFVEKKILGNVRNSKYHYPNSNLLNGNFSEMDIWQFGFTSSGLGKKFSMCRKFCSLQMSVTKSCSWECNTQSEWMLVCALVRECVCVCVGDGGGASVCKWERYTDKEKYLDSFCFDTLHLDLISVRSDSVKIFLFCFAPSQEWGKKEQRVIVSV